MRIRRNRSPLGSIRAHQVRSGLVPVVAALSLALIASVALAAPNSLARPRLLALAYGRFRPQGAPKAYLALRFTLREPRGQIVALDYQEINRRGKPDGIGGQGDGASGLGGRHDGAVETNYIPVSRRLPAGTHRIRVIAYGSLCTHSTTIAKASRTFTLHIPR